MWTGCGRRRRREALYTGYVINKIRCHANAPDASITCTVSRARPDASRTQVARRRRPAGPKEARSDRWSVEAANPCTGHKPPGGIRPPPNRAALGAAERFGTAGRGNTSSQAADPRRPGPTRARPRAFGRSRPELCQGISESGLTPCDCARNRLAHVSALSSS